MTRDRFDRFEGAVRALILIGILATLWLSLRGAFAQDRALERGTERTLRNGAHGSPPDWVARHDPQLGVALERALLAQVTLPSGSFVAHCRRAEGGCAARMHRMAELFVDAGAEHHVDPWLLAAIAVRESGGNPAARGARGEIGLMQLHPASRHGRLAARRCAEQPSDCTATIVDIAAHLVRRALDRCGSEADALGYYNSGRCEETAYARAVLARRERMRSGGAS